MSEAVLNRTKIWVGREVRRQIRQIAAATDETQGRVVERLVAVEHARVVGPPPRRARKTVAAG